MTRPDARTARRMGVRTDPERRSQDRKLTASTRQNKGHTLIPRLPALKEPGVEVAPEKGTV